MTRFKDFINEEASGGPVKVANMVPGTIYVATYKNDGRIKSEEFKFLGFAEDSDRQTPKWKTFKEAKAGTRNGYGEGIYMTGDWNGDKGSYYYLYGDRWCRGSGADRLSFTKKEEKK